MRYIIIDQFGNQLVEYSFFMDSVALKVSAKLDRPLNTTFVVEEY